MTLTLTPEPSTGPDDKPRVRADLEAPDGGTFVSLSIKRGADLLRRQPFVGASTSVGFDYEAPFVTPVTYTATGSVLPVSEPDWTEEWSSLSSWSGDTSDWSVADGEASSSVADAAISRDASGTIQRVTVADPVLVRVELLTTTGAVVCSLQVDASKVTLTGTASAQASGGGSFSLLLSDGTVTASADDSSWSLSREYVGNPVEVRLVALGDTYLARESTAEALLTYVTVGPSGDIFALTFDASTNDQIIVRFNANLGTRTPVITGLGVTTYQDFAIDSSGNFYLADYTNQQIVKYDQTGAFVDNWALAGRPMSVCVDSDDNVYVGTSVPTSRIYAFAPDGSALTDWSVSAPPLSLACDSSDNLYARSLTTSDKRIYKYSKTGTSLTNWAVPVNPGALTVADDVVYVLDHLVSGVPQVRMYDTSGASIRTWAALASRDAAGIAVSASGNVYLNTSDSSYTSYAIARFELIDSSIGELEVTPVIEPVPYTSTASTTLDETRAWLIHPSQPSLSVCIDEKKWNATGVNVSLKSAQKTSRPLPVSEFSPPGRTRSVVYPLGPRKAGAWSLVLTTPTLTARDAVLNVLADGAPLLLRSPGWDWDLPDGWYAVGDVDEARIVQPLQTPYRELPLPLTPVDSPPVALVPEWTYGDVLLAAPTYGDVLATFPTYLDVLTGNTA